MKLAPLALAFCVLPAGVREGWADRQQTALRASPMDGSISSPPIEERKGYLPLHAALHIHSRFSNGAYDIPELARLASRRKIDVLGLTDSFLTRVRYGVWPFRKLLSRSVSRPGILDHGVRSYLEEIESAARAHPDVVLVPGYELAPYYRWEGSTFGGLRLLDFDRHILVYGIEEMSAIENLPVIENETWGNTRKNWTSAAGPCLLALAGFGLLARSRRRIRLTYFAVRKRKRSLIPAALIFLAGIAWLYDQYPFGALSDPYSDETESFPYQAVVDYVRKHDGISFWSYPEARFSEVQMSGATMVSKGHPESLWRVDRYDGFEGLYGDRITITAPGAGWDQILLEYLRGGRERWPSVVSGIDFHSFRKGGWYELDRGQTILWARRKDKSNVLEAMRSGRGYAAFQGEAGRDLILRNFGVTSGDKNAIVGEVLEAASPVRLSALIDWKVPAQSSGGETAILEIVLNGKLLERREGGFPMRIERSEDLSTGKHYFRLRVKYKTFEILSNPIFCNIR